MPPITEFAAIICKLRSRLPGYSQRDLSKELVRLRDDLHCTPGTLSRWMNSVNPPGSEKQVTLLAEAFSLLLKDDDGEDLSQALLSAYRKDAENQTEQVSPKSPLESAVQGVGVDPYLAAILAKWIADLGKAPSKKRGRLEYRIDLHPPHFGEGCPLRPSDGLLQLKSELTWRGVLPEGELHVAIARNKEELAASYEDPACILRELVEGIRTDGRWMDITSRDEPLFRAELRAGDEDVCEGTLAMLNPDLLVLCFSGYQRPEGKCEIRVILDSVFSKGLSDFPVRFGSYFSTETMHVRLTSINKPKRVKVHEFSSTPDAWTVEEREDDHRHQVIVRSKADAMDLPGAGLLFKWEIRPRMRLADPVEAEELREIQGRSRELYEGDGLLDEVMGAPLLKIDVIDSAIAAGNVLVAVDEQGSLLGFALGCPLGNDLHLEQLSVLPEVGHLGVGRSLMDHWFILSQSRGFEAMSLVTYRDVRFNAPWYETLDFHILQESELNEEQSKLRRAGDGILSIDRRVFMRKLFDPRTPMLGPQGHLFEGPPPGSNSQRGLQRPGIAAKDARITGQH